MAITSQILIAKLDFVSYLYSTICVLKKRINMQKTILFLAAILILIPSLLFAQGKQRTLTHNGKKMVWNTKQFEVEVMDPKTGISSQRMLDERSTLFSWDGQQVSNEEPKAISRILEKELNKCIRKNKLKVPLFQGRDVKIHFQNYVIDTSGELVFYEVLFFPYRQSVQLYPNEYTPEMKEYLKVLNACLKDMPKLEKQRQPIYVETVIDL